MSSLKFTIPEHVLMNDDIHGQCVSSESWPHVVIIRRNGCYFEIERQRVKQGTDTLYYTNFVIKSVTATCEYMCAIRTSRVKKFVVVTGMCTCA